MAPECLSASPAPPVSRGDPGGPSGGRKCQHLLLQLRPVLLCSSCGPPAFLKLAGCSHPLAGTYRPEGAASDACLACPPGTYSAAGADDCTPCAAGTAASRAGTPQDATTLSCPACPAGKYAKTAGAYFCMPW